MNGFTSTYSRINLWAVNSTSIYGIRFARRDVVMRAIASEAKSLGGWALRNALRLLISVTVLVIGNRIQSKEKA